MPIENMEIVFSSGVFIESSVELDFALLAAITINDVSYYTIKAK